MEYKVLAADDETELLDALELYTETENIRLIKADNGITALEMFKTEKPHLVLLDIMMPGLDHYPGHQGTPGGGEDPLRL